MSSSLLDQPGSEHPRHIRHRSLTTYLIRTGFVLLGIAGCLTAGLAQDQRPSNSTISGTVVNSVTHETIGRALVYSPDNRFATMTDDHGQFVFDFSNVSGENDNRSAISRPNVLLAKKPGYLDDRSKPAPLINSNQSEITIELTPESLIVGHVSFPDPADRAEVVLYKQNVQNGIARWIQIKQARSRSDGEFRFFDLSPGKYKVFTLESTDRDPLTNVPNAQAFEYPPAYFGGTRDFAASAAIELGTGKTFVADLHPQRKPYYNVRIPVVNMQAPSGGMPQVTVYPQGQPGPGYQLGFNGMESAVEGMMPDGTYTVLLTTYGPASASGTGTFTVHSAPVIGQPIALVPDPTIPVIFREEFTSTDQQQTGQVGHVVTGISSTGAPPPQPKAYVSLEPVDDFVGARVVSMQTEKGDQPSIPGVAFGRYWVRADAVHGYVAALTSGGRDLLHQPLVVAPGSGDQPIEVVLRDDSASLQIQIEGVSSPSLPPNTAGTIYDGQPPMFSNGHTSGLNAYIYLVPLSDSPGRFMETGAWNGNATVNLAQVPPGTYRVMAFDNPQQIEYRDPAAMRAYDSKGQVIAFAPGQKQQIQLPIIKANER